MTEPTTPAPAGKEQTGTWWKATLAAIGAGMVTGTLGWLTGVNDRLDKSEAAVKAVQQEVQGLKTDARDRDRQLDRMEGKLDGLSKPAPAPRLEIVPPERRP